MPILRQLSLNLLSIARNAIIIVDKPLRIRFFNQAAEQLYGYTSDEVLNQSILMLAPDDKEASYREGFEMLFAQPEMAEQLGWQPAQGKCKDGTVFHTTGMTLISGRGGIQLMAVVLYIDHETESSWAIQDSSTRVDRAMQLRQSLEHQAGLERQLLQSQKMEVIGRLAGGVAHDFNNILTAIIGTSELLLLDTSLNDQAKTDVESILRAGQRARQLTRQLLTFARQQIIEPRPTDISDLLVQSADLLRRLTSAQIQLVVVPTIGLWLTNVDPTQVDQILVNLVVNAADAIGLSRANGRIVIETQNISLRERYTELHLHVEPGQYVMLSVSDNGSGMTQDVLERAFDPFYTTKPAGKGTGLGLATCYGIMHQHGGTIWAYSEVGVGTTMKCYFPAIVMSTEDLTDADAPLGDLKFSGRERILIAEDQDEVRTFMVRVLLSYGYRVTAVEDGKAAIEKLREGQGSFHLLITDVIMPTMGGKDLAAYAHRQYPAMPVLFISGYTDNTITHEGILQPGIRLLQKPFSATELVEKVRETLDAARQDLAPI